MFEQFPYVNFHELNLDWLIQKVKECYSPDNPPPVGLVLSVNGETGDVVLYKESDVELPAIEGDEWQIQRYVAGTHTLGIAFKKNSPAMRLDGETWYDIYDENNPPPYPVTSVNGQTGAVTGLYSASNPPPYPVTSVNGQTGAVTGLYNASNPPPYPVTSVNGQTGTVTITIPVTSVNGQTGAVTVPVAFKNNSANYLEPTTDSSVDEWGLQRGITSGTCGISFEIESGHVVGYLNFTDSNDQVIDSLKILTPADIPSSSGVISVNGQDGVVVLKATDIAMSGTDNTTVKANIDGIRADLANTWDTTIDYMKGSVVYYDGSLYMATADNAAGTWASQSWSSIVLANETVKRATEESIALVETTNTASQNIGQGTYVIWKDEACTAATDITANDVLNASAFNVLTSGIANDILNKMATEKAFYTSLLTATVAHTVGSVDLNNYKTGGTYYFTSGCSNAPGNYFLCVIFNHAEDFVLQIGIVAGSPTPLRYRTFASNTWSVWRSITGT